MKKNKMGEEYIHPKHKEVYGQKVASDNVTYIGQSDTLRSENNWFKCTPKEEVCLLNK